MSEKQRIVPNKTGCPQVENGTRQIYWEYFGLLDILPNCRQIMLPGSGHLTYLEQPDFFWTTVKKFFAAKSIHVD